MHLLPDQRVDAIGRLDRLLPIELLRCLLIQPVDLIRADASVVLLNGQRASGAWYRLGVERLRRTDRVGRAGPGEHREVELPWPDVLFEEIRGGHRVDRQP